MLRPLRQRRYQAAATPIMTVPELEQTPTAYVVTGNHWVSLPTVDPESGALYSANVVLKKLRGLLELCAGPEYGQGVPFLEPLVRAAGLSDRVPSAGSSQREAHWLPGFVWELEGGVGLELEIITPPGERGAVYLLRLKAPKDRRWGGEIGLRGRWALTRRVVGAPILLPGENLLGNREWMGGIFLEPLGSGADVAMAVTAGVPGMSVRAGRPEQLLPLGELQELSAPNGQPIDFELFYTVELFPGEVREFPFYLGFGLEREGALAQGIHLRRLGHASLKAVALEQLSRLLRPASDPGVEELLNRNLLFSYFGSVARPLDAPGVVSLRTRSPLHYGCAAFSEREALLWSLPAVLELDPQLAREVLLEAFATQLPQAGEQGRYLDGSLLFPGLGLDQLVAWILAFTRVLEGGEDRSLLFEPAVERGLAGLLKTIFQLRHPSIPLYRTFLNPSGGPADLPYLAHNNALLWRGLSLLAEVRRGQGRRDDADALELEAALVSEAIWEHLVMEREGQRVFAFASDLEGASRFHDDPAGSLQLLPSLGFCSTQHPIFRATLEQLYGASSPQLCKGLYPGLCSEQHPELPSLMAICADLWGNRQAEALEILSRAPLDGGLACEAFDPETGEVRAGRAYAALAGWLAMALLRLEGRGRKRR